MAFYDEMAVMAEGMLTEFGQDITFVKKTAIEYDPQRSQFETGVIVRNSASSTVNGFYPQTGIVNGRPKYIRSLGNIFETQIYYGIAGYEGKWVIDRTFFGGIAAVSVSPDFAADPSLVLEWTGILDTIYGAVEITTAYDAVAPTETTVAKGAVVPLGDRDNDFAEGFLRNASHKLLLDAQAVTPLVGDVCYFNGNPNKRYEVLAVTSVNPAGTPVLHKCLLQETITSSSPPLV